VAEGDGGGDVGDGRASVGVGVGATVAGAADVAGGVTDTGVQPAINTIATAQKRTDHALTVVSLTESLRCVDKPYKQTAFLYADRTAN